MFDLSCLFAKDAKTGVGYRCCKSLERASDIDGNESTVRRGACRLEDAVFSHVKDAVQRAGVGVILDFHGTVFDAFASVRTGHLEGQVEACHVSRIAQDSGFFVLSRNWWKWETSHVPEREYFGLLGARADLIFPYGNIMLTSTSKMLEYSRTVTLRNGMNAMKYTPQDIGKLVRETRKGLGVTQKALALTSGTGLRFVIELERGKATAEIGKVLTILQTLGIQLTLTPPPAATKRG